MVHSFPTRRSSDRRVAGAHAGARPAVFAHRALRTRRSEEHTSELQSHHPISYAVFCLKKKKQRGQLTVPAPLSMGALALFGPGVAGGRRSSAGVGSCFFFFNDTATTEIYTGWYTLSLHDALPISGCGWPAVGSWNDSALPPSNRRSEEHTSELQSHQPISYAVFCLKKKKKNKQTSTKDSMIATETEIISI